MYMDAEILSLILGSPSTTLFATLGLAAFIVVFDVESGISYNIPGPGQLGLAGIIAGLGSVYYFFATGGLQAFADEIAAGIFGSLVTAVVVAEVIRRR